MMNRVVGFLVLLEESLELPLGIIGTPIPTCSIVQIIDVEMTADIIANLRNVSQYMAILGYIKPTKYRFLFLLFLS